VDGQIDFQDGEQAARRRRLGEHLQQIRLDESVRGYKESGFGREGGLQGLSAYCRMD
jgi:acyl-CoA reductase-like NAD-dependent aldehyde dehydrogenase